MYYVYLTEPDTIGLKFKYFEEQEAGEQYDKDINKHLDVQ